MSQVGMGESSLVSHIRERRVAAIVALSLGAVATAMLLTTILTNPLSTLFSISALFGATASGWVALTNRGSKRVVGVVVGAGLLLLLIATLLADEEHRFFVLYAVLAVIAAAAAGRVALGKPPRAVTPESLAPAARRPALVVNPFSGDGRAAAVGLVAAARERGISVLEFDGSAPMIELVHRALDAGADAIGMAGGDGSLAAGAALAVERGVDFVCIPAGTRNHFALDLGLDRSDPVASLSAFGRAVRRRVDLAEVNGRPFLNNVSLGVYGEIVQDGAYRDDKIGTTLARLPDLITDSPQALDLRYRDPTGRDRTDAQVIHVSNNAYRLSGPAAGSRPRLNAGELGIVCARLDGTFRAAEVIARAMVGATTSETLTAWSAPTFSVQSSGPIPAGVDGEAVQLAPPVEFQIRPRAVSVRVPPDAPGVSPAARSHGYRRTVAELLRRAFLPATRWTDFSE